jgi:hypothetical protein
MATTKGPKKPSITVIDPTLLSEADKAALRAKARERVDKERRDAAMDAFLGSEVELARRAHIPNQEMKYITLDLAGHSLFIMLDGTVYFHGETYEVPKMVYDTMAEIVSRGWEHESEIGGANRELYRKPRNARIGHGMENLTTAQLMGVR